MYVAWFANCVTVARLGDAYRAYLLKRAAGVSFAVTLGTVLAERLLDLLVLAAMMGAGVLIVFGGSLLTTVPITPAGLGFTEAGMVIMLGWLGLDIYTATAATLLFRIINYWSIVVFGFVLYVFGRDGNRSTEERVVTPGVPTKIHRFFTGRS